MNIFPAIDLFEGAAVRLLKGDYNKLTVYNNDPLAVAKDFKAAGVEFIHIVDLEGAKDGTTPNIDIVEKIARESGLFVEIGGGIRNMNIADRYIESGVSRIILGTAAVKNREFLLEALKKHGDKVAVGVDIKDGRVAVSGWTEDSGLDAFEFCRDMQSLGVRNIICTDISKDGAMMGTNRGLYRDLSKALSIDITASGGVSSLEDIKALRQMNIYGAIIGKAYYTGAIDLKEALEVAK